MANHYVDFSAANNGDGSTAAQAGSPGGVGAFNTIVGITVTAGDSYWIRRSGTLTVSAAYTLSVAANFIGWPVAGDTFFATRPASGTSNGWDADVQTYAQVTCSTNSLGTHYLIISGSGADVERMKWTMTAGTQTTSEALCSLAANCTINNCYFLNTAAGAVTMYGIRLNGNFTCSISNTTTEFSFLATSTNTYYIYEHSGTQGDIKFYNCIFTFSNASNSATSAISCVHGSLGNSAGVLTFDTCTFNRSGNGAGTAIMVDFVVATTSTLNFVSMYNCTFTDTHAAAANISSALDTGVNLGTFIGTRLTMTAGSQVTIGKAGHYCHFARLTQTITSSSYAVRMGGGATFVCNNFTEVTGNGIGAINGQVLCDLYLQNTSFISANPLGTAATILAKIYEVDSGGTFGLWKFTQARGVISSDSVARTGGEAFSLKVAPSAGAQNNLHQLTAMLNGYETIFAAVTSSSTLITIYGAYKNYSPAPDSSQIWADCDYVDQGSGSRRATAASTRTPGTALTSDSSSWVGDSGLTSFKITIAIAPLQSCLAPIRIFTNMRQATAYFYIDPLVVVS